MAFHVPAMQASVPLLAPQDKLMKIAGINNMIHSVSTIASPALAALLISLFELQWILLIDVAGAIIGISTLLMVFIPNPEREDKASPHLGREMLEGLREIYSKPGLLWLFILALATGFIADSIGIGNAFIISGCGISLLGIAAFIIPPIRRMVKTEINPQSDQAIGSRSRQ